MCPTDATDRAGSILAPVVRILRAAPAASGKAPSTAAARRFSARDLAVLGLAVLGTIFLSACAPPPDREPEPESLRLQPVAFTALPGWAEDDLEGFAAAFEASCARLRPQPLDRPMVAPAFGTVGDWIPFCEALARQASSPPASLRAFLENRLRPHLVSGRDGSEGLFTGYFEYTLNGSRQPSDRHATPLHRPPSDLVRVNLADFAPEFRGRELAGRVENGRLRPYHDRGAIMAGALRGQGLELVWVDDPVDAFFLHIQGSGRIRLAEGGEMRVGFAARNGHPYTAIGRVLVARGEMPLDAVSMQSIAAWLRANPEQGAGLMAENRSYIFFRELTGPGPIGAHGAPLTANRSLAVDRAFFPMGIPFYVAAVDPAGALAPFRRLMVGQDTGAAIRGVVRGDLFLGDGEDAADKAGRMRMQGQYWILLPRELTAAGAS